LHWISYLTIISWILVSKEVSRLTGSRAYERFTGSQIAKVFHTKREIYNSTEVSKVGNILSCLPYPNMVHTMSHTYIEIPENLSSLQLCLLNISWGLC
jgi:hypothetical protein